jgi:hypothetical protein
MPLLCPLPQQDVNGKPLSVGDLVTVISVESCLSELPIEDQERLMRIVGQQRQILGFDASGFAWLCFVPSPLGKSDFCLFPAELSLHGDITV